MIWAVAGHPRTGSSALMRLLVDHGMAVLSRGSAQLDRRVWELPRRWPETGLFELAEGRAVKVFWRDLQWMPAGFADRFTVVRLVRDPAEVCASWRAMGADVSPADVVERLAMVRDVWPDAPEVEQTTLRDDPASVVALLREHGWPLTPELVAGAVVDRVLIRDSRSGFTIRDARRVVLAPTRLA